jgi:hypothetical protein
MRSPGRSVLVSVATAWIAAAGLMMPALALSQPAAAGRVSPAAMSVGVGSTMVSGAAFHADNTPIPRAKLRLRSIESGAIAGATDANGAGQFVFKDMVPGIYIVELVSTNARILAISNALAIARGESLTTFVRETSRPASLRDLFANSSVAISSAAAAMGVTAVSPQAIRPASPQK